MLRLPVIAVVGVLLATPVAADGYDDALACAQIVGDHAEAIRRCTEAINSGELDQETLARTYANRAYEHRVTKQMDKALADANQAVALNANDAFAHGNLADTYYEMNDNPAAIASYKEALRLSEAKIGAGDGDPTVGYGPLIGPLANLIDLHTEIGDDAAARGYAQKLYAVAPNVQEFFVYYDRYDLR